VESVWFDNQTGHLCVRNQDGYINGIPLNDISPTDWESSAPIKSFSAVRKGKTICCQHTDGEVTHFPADMWLPDGFTPKKKLTNHAIKGASQRLQRLSSVTTK
jgi:hypothetical protein